MSDKKLKAYEVREDGEGYCTIAFATNGATARREGASELGTDWECIESCVRKPEFAWKRFGALADCTCNDKPPALMLRPYALVNGREWYSVEFSVCGEVAGDWLDLRFYSVPMDQAIAKIPRAIELLGAAWNAAAGLRAGAEPTNHPATDTARRVLLDGEVEPE